MLKFAIKNLLTKKARMALVALSIIISASVALMAFNVSSQVQDGILNSFIYYDLIIGPSGSSTQLAMNTLFFTDSPLGTIPYSLVEELENSPLVNRVVPFTMGDSFNSSKVVGTSPLFLEDKTVKSGKLFSAPFEAVVGSSVASSYGLNVGDEIITSHGLSHGGAQHSASPLKVVGILKTTYTAYDDTVFTSVETVWEMHEHEEEEEAENAPVQTEAGTNSAPSHHGGSLTASSTASEEQVESHTGEVCAILVKTASLNAYTKLSQSYSGQTGLMSINPSAVLREVLDRVDLSAKIVYALSAVILLMNLIVVCVITLLNLISSRDEIQLMRLIGISARRVRQVFMIQNAILGAAATLLSLLLSHVALLFVNNISRAYGIVLNPFKLYPLELLIVLAVMLISVFPTILFISLLARKDALTK
ncbi:MAG: FtsX-like permease family protein [Clostridiales bacterium]|nr:FtsX-like permease family protein [Clostridiales bacterium]